jgi:hypothetical protein
MRAQYLKQLETVGSEAELMRLVGDFLGQWSPKELAAIPPHCRPGMVADSEQVADLAYTLTRARIETCGPQPLLEEMERFFATACNRISQLESAPRRIPGKSYLTR